MEKKQAEYEEVTRGAFDDGWIVNEKA